MIIFYLGDRKVDIEIKELTADLLEDEESKDRVVM